jgi:hypothetical protein
MWICRNSGSSDAELKPGYGILHVANLVSNIVLKTLARVVMFRFLNSRESKERQTLCSCVQMW